jgi:hypothetical protein
MMQILPKGRSIGYKKISILNLKTLIFTFFQLNFEILKLKLKFLYQILFYVCTWTCII